MKTVLEVLQLTTDHLKKKGITQPRRQAEELLSDVLGIPRMQIYLEHDRPLLEEELDRCRAALMRRAKGEPNAYIQGEVEFHSCRIKVNRDVLIPRQETGILVDEIIKNLSNQDLTGKVLADVCCGSGCIGLAIKKHYPALHVILSDLSPQALSVAKENARLNQLDVEFREGDLLLPYAWQSLDFFVCNPPYVSKTSYQMLDTEVRDFEPLIALVAEEDGYQFYRRLAEGVKTVCKPRARLWLEMGTGQGKIIQQLFEKETGRSGQVKLDWAGHDRFFFLEIE